VQIITDVIDDEGDVRLGVGRGERRFHRPSGKG
jgi:hypothetical protein